MARSRRRLITSSLEEIKAPVAGEATPDSWEFGVRSMSGILGQLRLFTESSARPISSLTRAPPWASVLDKLLAMMDTLPGLPLAMACIWMCKLVLSGKAQLQQRHMNMREIWCFLYM
uniref:Uncharacterized protein n=1 Tax=Romanomermis culicivorax TaxID=13658 RepID=A0A915IMF8_ROMCU